MQVKNQLSNLFLSAYVSADKSQSEALTSDYHHILKMAPMAPMSHREDAHKADFLRNAVVGYPWAVEPLS